mgnify:CR=1 FL=1|jgi:hypothetical protein
MTHRKHLTGGLIAIGISMGLSSVLSAAPEAPANFRIMSEKEVADHTAVMDSLQGSAREEYRNTHYRELQERARRQGYLMPTQPPWAARTADTTVQVKPLPKMPGAAAPADIPGPAPRIDRPAGPDRAIPNRSAARTMPPQRPSAAGETQPGTSADISDAMTAYREAMRSRFDAFMRDRQALYEEDERRHREQTAATRQQDRATQQALPPDTVQPPRYPGMPVWAPPYPMAFPGYPQPYPGQR